MQKFTGELVFSNGKMGFSVKNKKLLVIALLALLLVAVLVGLVWHMNHYKMVDFKFYPKDAQALDLREEEITVKHFDKLRRQLPGCEIRWNVPFQDTYYDSEITELTVNHLTETDLKRLAYFEKLKVLDARSCTDYSLLLNLRTGRPDLNMLYNIPLDGTSYDQDSASVELSGLTAEELSLLPCLTKLDTVIVKAGGSGENLELLQDYCKENRLAFCISAGSTILPEDAQQVRIEGITEEDLSLLEFLPQLKSVHLIEPAASAEAVLAFQSQRSDLTVTWEKTVCGVLCSNETVDVDLSEQTVPSIEAVEQGLAYFPNVKSVFLGEPGIDNEQIAAYRERSQDKYKVVWVVDLSGRMKVRTDIDNFMPSRDGWGYVRDHEVDNIRYCEDLICIDLGHMGIKDVSFLEPLVNLEYLILAHTEVQYINGIENCKKLKFLELDWSCIRDLSPLVGCTALEDLNIGNTWPDITPVLQMTWLKNLYMIYGSGGDAWKASQALPNTRVVASGNATVGSGWRKLPNYYAMRDILGMYYMHG